MLMTMTDEVDKEDEERRLENKTYLWYIKQFHYQENTISKNKWLI